MSMFNSLNVTFHGLYALSPMILGVRIAQYAPQIQIICYNGQFKI